MYRCMPIDLLSGKKKHTHTLHAVCSEHFQSVNEYANGFGGVALLFFSLFFNMQSVRVCLHTISGQFMNLASNAGLCVFRLLSFGSQSLASGFLKAYFLCWFI